MTIREERVGGVLVIAPAGRVDSTTSGDFDARLVAAHKEGDRVLVVDFSGVDYISSAGLRVMLSLAKRTKSEQGRLALCGLEDAVRQVFDLAGFLPLFAVEPTRAAAVARVSS